MNTDFLLSFLVEFLAKSALILGAAALVARAWQSASAAQRHLVWCTALVTVLLLPLTRLHAPRWTVPLQRVTVELPRQPQRALPPIESNASLPSDAAVVPAKPRGRWLDWKLAMVLGWSVGAGALLALRLLGSAKLVWMRTTTLPLADARAEGMAAAIFRELGIRRTVQLRVSRTSGVPLTWGTLRPVLLLPAEARAWDDTRLATALRHEAGHIARGDYFTRSLASLACIFYWPSPLVWLAARQLRAAQEEATDDLVLRGGTAPDEYAAQLFDVARTLAAQHRLARYAVPMASPSTLERRMLAIVDERRDRRPLTLRAVTGGVLAVALTLGLATAAQIQAQTPAATTTPPGSAAVVTPPATSETAPAPGAPQVQIEAKFIEFSGDQASLPDLLKPAPDESAPGIRGVQAEGQARAIIRALEGLKGVDRLSAPRVVTVSGHRATIKIIREFRYPTAFEKDPKTNEWALSAFDKKNVGITFDVTPEVMADGTIALQMTPEATEFEGYRDLDAAAESTAKLPPGQEAAGPYARDFPPGHRKQPIFSTRKITTSVSVFDGQTVVLGPMNREDVQKVEDRVPVLGDIPLVGGLFTSKSEVRIQRRLFVFVTATIAKGEKKSAAVGTPQPLQFTADSTSYDAKTGEAKASGNVEIKTAGASIRTEQATVIPTNKPTAASPAGNEPDADDPAAKLILPTVEFRDVKLSEAIEFLVAKSRDGGAAGFNVVVAAKRSP